MPIRRYELENKPLLIQTYAGLGCPTPTQVPPMMEVRARALRAQGVRRKRLLLINNSGHGPRKQLNERLLQAFGPTLGANTYLMEDAIDKCQVRDRCTA